MRLYQPVLFVGLGGTGCDIGAELERRLRDEICGPDGSDFHRARGNNAAIRPYQLPSCVQFVYADMNQAELDDMPRRVVPGSQHIPAAQRTAHYVRELVPVAASYQHLAVNLRLEAESETDSWLPPESGEPKVTPLSKGAGQFPTVGRAALFGTFLNGIRPAISDLKTAVDHLVTSAEDLIAMGGRAANAVDVFVAFSVAGGTGAGIFYDYLHLIGYVFEQAKLQAKIYPLVLMPSAFAEGFGGGRAAELNAGRALLDLFRLVDHQNAGDAERHLRGQRDLGVIKPYEQAVRYPTTGRLVLPPGTVQTGFLFAKPAGAEREDLHRSIASLVLSLIGTELAQEDMKGQEAHQSFADWWINAGNDRQTPADNAIGNRGVSAALVASLTVPIDDLAGLIGGRLLRTAIKQLSTPNRRPEDNKAHIEEFLTAANVHAVLARDGLPFQEPAHGSGAHDIASALNERSVAMKDSLADLQRKLGREVPPMVQSFDPRAGIKVLLGKLDVFRVQRVVFGNQALADDIDRAGAAGLLSRRQAAPQPPAGLGAVPPTASELKNKGMIRLKWTDREPALVRRQQDAWYRWRTHVAWAENWNAHKTQWKTILDDTRDEFDRLTKALLEFVAKDEDQFGPRAGDLYLKRIGVSYLLPPGGAGMDQFYQLVIKRLREKLMRETDIQAAATEADLVEKLIEPDGWAAAYDLSFTSADLAVSDLRDQVKAKVKAFLREPTPGQQPLLPRMHDLLVAAAGQGQEASSMKDYLDEFRGKLAALIPVAFTPQGTGPMKVLITYPAEAKHAAIEAFLTRSLNLPKGAFYDWRSTAAESISVVMFRTSMGVTEVQEVRDVLRLWASAMDHPERSDFLRWRQRTGYRFDYLAMTEDHRIEILHRLLCALWNGKVYVDGDARSPDQVHVELGGGVRMILPLTPLEQASSWGSLLRAYELWTFSDDELHRRFARQLMRELPRGLDGSHVDPDPLYWSVRELAEAEVKRLDEMIEELSARRRDRAVQLRDFWAATMPAALARDFAEHALATRDNLLQLEKAVKRRNAP